MNRAERRAIAQGKGRIEPMVEILDVDSAEEYGWRLTDPNKGDQVFTNIRKMFISYQVSYMELQDFICDEPCLLY